jgi:hypothetical protein
VAHPNGIFFAVSRFPNKRKELRILRDHFQPALDILEELVTQASLAPGRLF